MVRMCMSFWRGRILAPLEKILQQDTSRLRLFLTDGGKKTSPMRARGTAAICSTAGSAMSELATCIGKVFITGRRYPSKPLDGGWFTLTAKYVIIDRKLLTEIGDDIE